MRPHLMIIDDAEDQLQLMRSVFKMINPALQVVVFNSGEEALKALNDDPKLRPRVILLDLRMPGKCGLEVLVELKSNSLLKRIPVCAFSNGEVEEDVCECYERGASFYFRKPVGLEDLRKFAGQFASVWFDYASHCPR